MLLESSRLISLQVLKKKLNVLSLQYLKLKNVLSVAPKSITFILPNYVFPSFINMFFNNTPKT